MLFVELFMTEKMVPKRKGKKHVMWKLNKKNTTKTDVYVLIYLKKTREVTRTTFLLYTFSRISVTRNTKQRRSFFFLKKQTSEDKQEATITLLTCPN